MLVGIVVGVIVVFLIAGLVYVKYFYKGWNYGQTSML